LEEKQPNLAVSLLRFVVTSLAKQPHDLMASFTNPSIAVLVSLPHRQRQETYRVLRIRAITVNRPNRFPGTILP
jgi:hypothetical protein